jgi:hypothetical protein
MRNIPECPGTLEHRGRDNTGRSRQTWEEGMQKILKER